MSQTAAVGTTATVLHLLHRASQSADDLLANRLSDKAITPRQLTVLQAVAADPEASQTALVSTTGIDRSTLADIVKRLVDAELLQRERMPLDARMYAVQLTAKGEELLEEVRPIAYSVSDEILQIVDEEDKRGLLRALQAIADTLGPVASAKVSARAKSLRLKNA